MTEETGYLPAMAQESGIAHRDYWLGQAKAVRRQVNLAWWLETMSMPLVLLALIGAAGLLWVRRAVPSAEPWQLSAALGGSVLVLALASWWRAGRRFERTEDSLVRIEAAMRMRNALSAAREGVAPWPAPVKRTDAGLDWQWPRLLVPPLGALALLAAGIWLPVSPPQTSVSRSPEEPQAWKQLRTELDYLAKEDVVDEKYLEETRKKLDELKSQEEDQWFSHSSLEATDSLKKAHRVESQRVQRELGRADKALGQIEKNAGSASQAEKNRLMEQFDQALQGLQNGAMKPNPKLLEQMQQLDLKDLGQLTPEQLQQLRENLQKNAQGLKGAQGGDGEWDDELLAGDGNGEGDSGEDGDGDGDGDGSGGVDRGPGHAPGVLGKQKDPLATGDMTGLQAHDLSHAAPGDLLELQDGEHEVDRTPSSLTSGGGTEATGKGGDRVWRESLDPDEQRVLKRFFE